MSSNLFHELNHVHLVCKDNHHTCCGFSHHIHNPLIFIGLIAPGQNLCVSQTAPA